MRRFLLLLLTIGFLTNVGDPAMAAGAKPEYKIGDRLAQPGSSASSVYKETGWDALIPKDWNPFKQLRALNFGALKDSDPRAAEAMRKMREIWDSAPVDPSLRGKRIRIAGFVVPLEHKGDWITEFLLVPYFGACIHVPPPPANQIIYVVAGTLLKKAEATDAVWVSGTMSIAHAESMLGASGYKMKADVVVPYTETH
jgi:hypothetical protein